MGTVSKACQDSHKHVVMWLDALEIETEMFLFRATINLLYYQVVFIWAIKSFNISTSIHGQDNLLTNRMK